MGGIHLTYGGEISKLRTLLSNIVDDEDSSHVNELFDHIMEGSTGSKSPTKDDTLMNLNTLKESENWVSDEGVDDNGMHYIYSECIIGDVIHSVVTYETVPENFQNKIPSSAKSTSYSRIYTYNHNTKFATSHGFLHYTVEASITLFGSVVLASLVAGLIKGASILYKYITNGRNPQLGEADAEAIGDAGEEAAGEEVGVEVNITIDEDLLFQAAGEGLVEEGIVDISLGPLGFLLFVATIIIIALIALILWVWSYIDRTFVSRVLVFNATKTAITINARYFDNVNTDSDHLPGILDEHSSVSKVLPAVYHRVPPMPPGTSLSTHDASVTKQPTFNYIALEDSNKQASINFAMYSIVNDSHFLDGLGTLISLEPHTEQGKSPTYNDFSNAFYKYEIRSIQDNLMGIENNHSGNDYSSLYKSLGSETTFKKEDLGGSLELIQATDALGGNGNGLYSVVKVLRDKDISF